MSIDVTALGGLLVCAAAAGFGTLAIFGKLAATTLIATTASMVPYGLVAGGPSIPAGLDQWLLVLGIGLVGTAAPVVLFVRGLERIEASQASVIGTSEPAATVLLGVALLGEPVTPILLVGGGLVLCAVPIVQREGRPAGMVVH